MEHKVRHYCANVDQGQRLIFLDMKLETLAPTLLNQPSLQFQPRDPFVCVFFRHAAFLNRGMLDCTLDTKRHFVRRPRTRGVINT